MMVEKEWWLRHSEIVLLAHYVAKTTNDAKVVAHAVEKPWNYEDEYKEAVKELDEGPS